MSQTDLPSGAAVREWACVNGELMPAEQARVSVFDSGFMQGVGLFETMRAYRGRVFRAGRHVDRLIQSARALGWTAPIDADALLEAVHAVTAATEADSARVRLTVSTGSLRAGASDAPGVTVVASASPGAEYPLELYQKGVTLAVSPWRQAPDPTAGHKTTSYFGRLAALRAAHQRGAFEALWLTPDERIAEGSISSLFAVVGDELLTPPLDTPVLPGITRATVLELAAAGGIRYRETPFQLDNLLAADEIFLTNSLMQLMPVVRIERSPIGIEKPGELTLRLLERYRELVARECGDA
ncbi:MAG: aminotransferase class IV [Phycisphaerae bacterium]|jgi:branched-chain amino acid aminotransferase|nr:aminotransferase class IV [Phycisphaerae bacterium]MCZ2398257.1 aminotransferase class IV [Phycisphaerae bacterium]